MNVNAENECIHFCVWVLRKHGNEFETSDFLWTLETTQFSRVGDVIKLMFLLRNWFFPRAGHCFQQKLLLTI